MSIDTRIKDRISSLNEEIQELQSELDTFKNTPNDIRLAIILHDTFCHSNHTDGCGWTYEDDSYFEKSGSAKNRWLLKAGTLLAKESYHNIIKFIDLLGEISLINIRDNL